MSGRKLHRIRGIFVCVFMLGFAMLPQHVSAQQANNSTQAVAVSAPLGFSGAVVPQLIKFSGVALDLSGKPMTGTANLTFSIYAQQSGGEPLWFETQTVELDSAGQYTVLLGATRGGLPMSLFTSGEARWLGIEIGNGPEEARVLLLSVPYALEAGNAETLAGKPLSDFVLKSGTTGVLGSILAPGGAKPKAELTNTTGTTVTTAGGTVGYLPLWDSTTDITKSALFQSSGNIGLGTTTPASPLEISMATAGVALTLSGGGTGGFGYADITSGPNRGLRLTSGGNYANGPSFQLWQTGSAFQGMYFDAGSKAGADINFRTSPTSGVVAMIVKQGTGLVGIGTTTPSTALDVNGTVTATSYSGSGAGLTSLDPANIASGTAGISITGNAASATTAASATNATELEGVAAADYALNNAENTFTTNQAFNGILIVKGAVAGSTTSSAGYGATSLRFEQTSGDEPNAGVIDYRNFDANALSIVGAGSTAGSREVHVFDELGVDGPAVSGIALHVTNTGADAIDELADGSNVNGTWLILDNSSTGGTNWNVVSTGSRNIEGAGLLLFGDNTIQGDNSDVMTLTSAGDVGIGTTSPADPLDVAGEIHTSTCFVAGSTTVGGTCSSDERLKKDIRPFAPSLDKLAELQPVRFNWRPSNPDGYRFGAARSTGLIAQQVKQVFPQMVGKDKNGYYTVNYSLLPFMLLAGVRQLKTRNDDLTFQVQAQRRQLEQADARLAAFERASAVKDARLTRLQARTDNLTAQNRKLASEVAQIEKSQRQMAILLTKLDSRLRGNDKTENASAHPSRSPQAKRAQIARVNF